MTMRLKAKYRTGASYKQQKSSSNHSGSHKHNKLSDQAKRNLAPQAKRVLVVDGGTGARSIVTE